MAPLTTLKHRLARLSIGVSLAAMMAFGAAMPALAAEGDTGFTVTGSSLAVVSATEAAGAPVTLTGFDQTSSFDIGLTVNDPTGTGAGWKVTALATTFEITAVGPNQGKKLATGASVVQTPTGVACVALSTCDPATSDVAFGTRTIPTGVGATAVPIYNAAVESGLGQMTATLPIEVSLPAGSTYAGTYNSTLTIAITSAP